ncbi:MAG: hypothetical protein JXA71_05950 [Chitinispirillaceae bacterium]|nr:hypothetical protein [Chitinispirillaceae bacterium]
MTVASHAGPPLYLRGKAISSTQRPLDSVIVRLLKTNTAVYTKPDGSFVIGDPVGSAHPAARRPLAPSLELRNGTIVVHGVPSSKIRIAVFNLQGKMERTVARKRGSHDRAMEIALTNRNRSGSGIYMMKASLNNGVSYENRFLIATDGRFVFMSGVSNQTSVGSPMNMAAMAASSGDTVHCWKPGYKAKKTTIATLVDSLPDITLDTASGMQNAPAPLFRDPVCDGAADPTIIWNRQEKAYWIFYTNRRVNCCPGCTGVQWVFGTDIGIASSYDGGATWLYRGIAKLKGKNDLNWDTNKNTFWAVEVIYDNGVYHMYASITPGILSAWNESIADIVHLSATDPLNGWSYDQLPYPSIHQGIDPTVHTLGDGKWYMWGKFADVLVSTDLVHWTVANSASPRTGEAPYVFFWKNYYWIIWDPTSSDGNAGLVVKRSSDGRSWATQANILGGEGTRPGEGGVDGKHCSVAVLSDRAYIIYFTQGGNGTGNASCLQAAPLYVNNGALTANRTAAFDFILKHYDDPMNQGR